MFGRSWFKAVMKPDAVLWILEVSLQGWAHPQSHVQPGECAEQAECSGARCAGPAVSQGPRRGCRARSNYNLEQPDVPSTGQISAERCWESRGLTRVSFSSRGIL